MAKQGGIPLLLKTVRIIFPKIERLAPGLASAFFWNLFFTPLHYPIPDKEKEVEKQADRFIRNIGGRNIQVYSWGEGPLILLVHGWAGRATQFRKFIPELVTVGYRVVGFDGPAHGQSGGRKTNIEEFAGVVKELVDELGKPAGVIAHSFGGGVCLYCCRQGVPIKKLINVASPTIADEIINTYLRAVNGSWAIVPRFKDRVLKTFGRPFESYTSLVFSKDIAVRPDLLLIHDTDDKEVPIVHAHLFVKTYPGTQLLETYGLGHTRILKDEMVIERCKAFLKSN
jgi:pimeloyl-ACP methyl ester carboxylesterase